MRKPILFRCVDVVSDGVSRPNQHVLVLDGLVTEIGDRVRDFPDSATIVDGPGILSSGLVDTHIHGTNGFDVMRPGDVAPMSIELLAQGITGFLPTVVPCEPEVLLMALGGVSGDPVGARVLGVHAEGPFLSPAQPGMFNPAHFKAYDVSLWEEMVRRSAAPIILMTVAAEELHKRHIQNLQNTGVVLSLGHSDASAETTEQLFSGGMLRATHAYNAMRSFHHREPGVVGAILSCGQVDTELILDGLHVSQLAARLLWATRTSGRIVLVSDRVPPAGRPSGAYIWAGRRVVVDDESVRLSSGRLAGSGGTLDGAVRRAVKWLSLSPAKALQMASEYPRASIGVDAGGLRIGSVADLAFFDPELRPRMTVVDGSVRWTDPSLDVAL